MELVWELPAGESLAYRFEATLRASDRGQSEDTLEVSGYVFVDIDDAGAAVVHMEAEPPIADAGSVAFEDALGRFLFPLPEKPLGDEAVEQSFVIEGLGTTATQSSPDLALDEVIEAGDRDGDRVTLSFSRRGEDAGESLVEVELSDEGEGVFDIGAGRYEALERRSVIAMESAMGGEHIEIETKATWSLTFDAERAAERTRARAERRARATEGLDLDEYLERYPASAEIERAAEKLAAQNPGADLLFHAVANPVETWSHAMSLDEGEATAFTSTVALLYREGEPVPDELIEWIKRALPDTPNLTIAVAQWPDARLRPELEAFAAGDAALPEDSAYDSELIAEAARETLDALARGEASPRDLAEASPEEFLQLGMSLMAGDRDPRPLVPVLIDAIEESLREAASTPGAQAHRAELAVQWLEGITSRSFGMNVGGWREFWAENQDASYCQWQIDAAEQDREALVSNALGKLGACEGVDEAAEVLAEHTGASRRAVSLVAARALAELEDPRAIPALFDAMEHGAAQERAQALVALARFHSTTLGFDPQADEDARAAAIARWRAWAERAHGESESDSAGEGE